MIGRMLRRYRILDKVGAGGMGEVDASRAAYARQAIRDVLFEHEQYIREHGEDLPAIRDWTWGGGAPGPRPADRSPSRPVDAGAANT